MRTIRKLLVMRGGCIVYFYMYRISERSEIKSNDQSYGNLF